MKKHFCCQALCPFCGLVSVCQKGVHFVSLCLKVQKGTQTDTKVSHHPPTHHETFFGLK